MNATTIAIICDLNEHANSTPAEIGSRLWLEPQSIRYHIRRHLKHYLLVTAKRRGRISARYCLRDGAINWCPACGYVLAGRTCQRCGHRMERTLP